MKITLPLPPNMAKKYPKRGHPHTPEFKAAVSARFNTWTPEQIQMIRDWYAGRDGVKFELDKLAALVGHNRQYVCRKARQLGLTNPRRTSGRKPRAKYATAEDRRIGASKKLREWHATHEHPRGARGLKHTPEAMARIQAGAARWRATASKEEKDAITDRQQATKLKRYGRLSPKLTGSQIYSRCKHGRREDLGGQFFRSSWEANYARFLNFQKERGIIASWEYEADTFWFEKIRRGVRSYTPDFKIIEPDGTVYYVEVKGWMDAKSQTKIRRIAKYHPTVELRVVASKAYYEIEKKLGGAIAGWEKAA